MQILCTKCGADIGTFDAKIPGNASVHCGLCGHDFGVRFEPTPAPASVPDATGNSTPTA